MSSRKILVVDDDESLLYANERILREAGYTTRTASTGVVGLGIVAKEKPDLVLLDAQLPDVSGFEICRMIKRDSNLKSTFVVILSGTMTSPDHQADGLESGADGYLTKPIEKRALLAHIGALMRMRAAEDELRAANRRLEDYNRLKAEFVANMSHELRTPLNAIIGFAQLMKLSKTGPKLGGNHVDAVERILRNSRHLLTLIDGVLDLSKIEAGRMIVNLEHVDIVDTVQAAFGELQSLAGQKNLEYRLTVHGEIPIGFSDPLRVRQVVINLVSNALKFTTKGGVWVELSPWNDDAWRLVVRDSGVGIKSEHLGFIFDRFRQVDGSTTRKAGGAGLGLTIVREIVHQLGGEVEADSIPGEGSTFTVTLPLVVQDKARSSIEATADQPPTEEDTGDEALEENPSNGERPLVLIIEDDQDATVLLTATLSDAGYDVRVAEDGAAGIRMAREHNPAAITLDIMMPRVDGWRVLKSLKSDPGTAEIPVVICSIVDNRALGYQLGASDYLVKPVTPERLVEAVARVGAPADGIVDYILVVDDEQSVRELVVLALEQANYVVRAAPSGETALKIAEQHVPRAVLCDLMMPGGMSGFELIARLRTDPRTANTPIVVVTGKDVTPQDRALLRGQIADVVRKGDLLLPDLEDRLRHILEEIGVATSDGQDPRG
jgi:DNA-binding response OmpR family regulator/two-component sensor histidine kinase